MLTVIIILISLFLIYSSIALNKSQQEEKRRKERIKQKEEERLKQNIEFQNLQNSRLEEFGALTKSINISYKKNENIYVYETAQVLFIMGEKYNFNDILSCSIEKSIYKKGSTKTITTPDKGEMAEQQVLWGMGKSYNVKSKTTTTSTPDKYKYEVFIGIKSISNPLIKIETFSIETAKEIESLMQTIIEFTK